MKRFSMACSLTAGVSRESFFGFYGVAAGSDSRLVLTGDEAVILSLDTYRDTWSFEHNPLSSRAARPWLWGVDAFNDVEVVATNLGFLERGSEEWLYVGLPSRYRSDCSLLTAAKLGNRLFLGGGYPGCLFSYSASEGWADLGEAINPTTDGLSRFARYRSDATIGLFWSKSRSGPAVVVTPSAIRTLRHPLERLEGAVEHGGWLLLAGRDSTGLNVVGLAKAP